MAYADDEFWLRYEGFVKESFDRHEKAIFCLLDSMRPVHSQVVDLGCGRVKESARFFSNVVLTDKEPSDGCDFKLDYMDSEALESLLNEVNPAGVVSFFSIELTHLPRVNERLYGEIFRTCKSVEWILSAGIYYAHKPISPTVYEAGGLLSWQSIGPVLNTETFTETRLLVPAPSKLFGPYPVEVWRLLERKP